MTTLTLRRINDDFIVTGPDIEPAKFESRSDAKYWCVIKYPGSPIKEIGADESSVEAEPCRGRAFAPKGSSHSQNQKLRRVGRGSLKAWAGGDGRIMINFWDDNSHA